MKYHPKAPLRHRILWFIVLDIFHTPTDSKPNWICRTLTYLLFPTHLFLLFRDRLSPVKYDFSRDIFSIYGINYSGDLLRGWGRYGLPTGAIFQIMRSEENTLILNYLGPSKPLLPSRPMAVPISPDEFIKCFQATCSPGILTTTSDVPGDLLFDKYLIIHFNDKHKVLL